MTRIMSDNDVRGHVVRLLEICLTSSWSEIWAGLGIEVYSFDHLGLSANASDAVVWRACQQNDIILITANRSGAIKTRWKTQFATKTPRCACPCLLSRIAIEFSTTARMLRS